MNIYRILNFAGENYQVKIPAPTKFGIDNKQSPRAYSNVIKAINFAKSNDMIVSSGIVEDKKYGVFFIHDFKSKTSFIVIVNDRFATIGRKRRNF